jgi:hypothetical protein
MGFLLFNGREWKDIEFGVYEGEPRENGRGLWRRKEKVIRWVVPLVGKK